MDLKKKDRLIEEKGLSVRDVHNLFRFWDQLSQAERQLLLIDISNLDARQLIQQKQLLDSSLSHFTSKIEPFTDFSYAGNQEDRRRGLELIRKGQAGCLLLAGGQGSRLDFPFAKGMYPVSVIKHKSLFQIHAEKVLAASQQVGRPLLLAVMTSPLNRHEIEQFFIDHQYFGLDVHQVFFFTQKMLPFLNKEGELFLETPYQIAKGPNGNGYCLSEFVASGIWEKWNQLGVKYLNMIPVDNPLADPFDAELLGFHDRQHVDIASKSVEKVESKEKVGVFVKQNGGYRVVEYSEMREEDKEARDVQGRLAYRCASLSLFSFSMEFIEKIANKETMPLHLAWKAVSYVDNEGVIRKPIQANAWKFESFIFDVLEDTRKVRALIYPREMCFAPLKNKEGNDSPTTVKEALLNKDRFIYEEITRKKAPKTPFELSQEFYYPTPDLIDHWRSIEIGSDQQPNYINAKEKI